MCVVVVALLCIGYLAVVAGGPGHEVDPESTGAGVLDIQKHGHSTTGVDVEEVALPWALCILPFLGVAVGVRTLALEQPNGPLLRAAVVGIVKAMAWFFTLKAVRQYIRSLFAPLTRDSLPAGIVLTDKSRPRTRQWAL